MKFFTIVRESITSGQFYQDHAQSSLKKAFKYITKLALVQAVFLALLAALFTAPSVKVLFSPATLDKIVTAFPAELKITIKNGQTTTNVKEPYYIPIPAEFLPVGDKRFAEIKNILTIDTLLPVSADRFRESKTLLLLSKDSLVAQKKSLREITVQPLSDLPDMTVDRAEIRKFIDNFQPLIRHSTALVVAGAFIVSFVGCLISTVFIVLISSIVLWAIAYLRKSSLGFTSIFTLGLYASTFYILLTIIARLVGELMNTNAYAPWYVGVLSIVVIFFSHTRKIFTQHD